MADVVAPFLPHRAAQYSVAAHGHHVPYLRRPQATASTTATSTLRQLRARILAAFGRPEDVWDWSNIEIGWDEEQSLTSLVTTEETLRLDIIIHTVALSRTFPSQRGMLQWTRKVPADNAGKIPRLRAKDDRIMKSARQAGVLPPTATAAPSSTATPSSSSSATAAPSRMSTRASQGTSTSSLSSSFAGASVPSSSTSRSHKRATTEQSHCATKRTHLGETLHEHLRLLADDLNGVAYDAVAADSPMSSKAFEELMMDLERWGKERMTSDLDSLTLLHVRSVLFDIVRRFASQCFLGREGGGGGEGGDGDEGEGE